MVESHLTLIKNGKQATAHQQYCALSETLKLHTLSSFKVKSCKNLDSAKSSIETCTAEIETTQFRMKLNPDGTKSAEKELLTEVKFQVWDSDQFFQSWAKSRAEINNLERTTAEIIGRAPVYLPQPQRSEVNSASKCLSVEADGVVN